MYGQKAGGALGQERGFNICLVVNCILLTLSLSPPLSLPFSSIDLINISSLLSKLK